MKQTHETYMAAIRDAVIHRVAPAERKKILKARLVYGLGDHGIRGNTCYGKWEHDDRDSGDVIELCINGEEDAVQIAGTMLHEMGHVLAGVGEGHGPIWKENCHRLGLVGAIAAGTNYHDRGMFDDDFMKVLKEIPMPTDGRPGVGSLGMFKGGAGGCKAGHGTRGGKSRGKGSGSRLKKIQCDKCDYTCYATQKWIDVGRPTCPCGQIMIAAVEEK